MQHEVPFRIFPMEAITEVADVLVRDGRVLSGKRGD